MRIVLTELKPQLEASAKETAETMKQIETEETSVKRATVLVKRDENIANAQAEVAKQLKTECEADLAEALPALDEAIGLIIYLFIYLKCVREEIVHMYVYTVMSYFTWLLKLSPLFLICYVLPDPEGRNNYISKVGLEAYNLSQKNWSSKIR